MKILTLLFVLANLALFVSYVWLTVLAFRKSPGWGLAVLLLSPFSAAVFAFKHWSDVRKPFLIHAGSCVYCFGFVVYAFSALGGFQMFGMAARMQRGEVSEAEAVRFVENQMDRMENSGLLGAEEKAQVRNMRQAFRQAQEGNGGAPPEGDPSTVEAEPASMPAADTPPRVRVEPTDLVENLAPLPPGENASIPVRDAGDHVGEFLVVVNRDGTEHKGTLASADARRLVLERYLAAGTISIEVPTGDVRSLRLKP